MAEGDVDIDIQIQIQVLQNLLLANPTFITDVRLALSQDVRSKVNMLGTWAQQKPRPKTTNPNTPQRIW
jgi:hypothetical protein